MRKPSKAPIELVPGEEEEAFYEEAEQERLALRNQSYRQDIQFRGRFAYLYSGGALFWLLGVFAVILLDGFGWWGFEQSDAVLAALLGAVTINIVSLVAIVARYLFPNSDD